ncbi:ATP-dependent helicase [Kerstersia gyiorum]|jgi:DNA helicase-2/ATP-dependent DNA helicase PcrA|uniref:ATP-dependent helicase n=1 Tax=Kerstersia gyiorum TaxID=206506 RepID=UPI00242D0FBF|nr:ATP-dependent helicase [Kerstersia gyiorum]MCH4271906.1 ATP-dependent helicase [Kerstersia gyiorum]MCI1229440.1 ATP-dependent helicase [Kerstersia gyiorum]
MSESENRLNSLIESLTPIQRQASAWNEGAFLLLAGPGSGKTRVLTARISRLLADSPDDRWRILALTFTNRAADEMRGRIVDIVPEAEDRLFIGTFHSFAGEILRQNGTLLGINTDFRIYSTTADRIELLERAMTKAGVERSFSPEKVLAVLDRLRDRLVGPDECERLFENPERAAAVSKIYAAYDDFLLSENAVDFPALIFKAHFLFNKFPAIARKYSSGYKYICLDEFQDTNSSQYRLLRALTGSSYKNVFAVADDDQIIYQWNGASHKRLEQFRNDYQPSSLQMPTNFRCPAEVVALANRLVSHNIFRSPGKSPLEAGKAQLKINDRVRLLHFSDQNTEAAGVAKDIAERHGSKIGNVAVIARTKALLEGVQRALNDIGIQAQIAQRRDSFASPPYVWLHSALNLANRRTDQRIFLVFVESSAKFMGIKLEPQNLASLAATTHGDLLRTWVSEARKIEALSEPIQTLLDIIASQLAERLDHVSFIRQTLSFFKSQQEGLEAEFPQFDEDARAWAELAREITSSIGASAGLETFLQELDLRSKEPPLGPNVLPLLTVHGSKGNEFDHVYVVGLAEDVMPSFQSKNKGDTSPEMEEERRNCFVAITRCMESLTLSYGDKYRNWAKSPSRFLIEMGLLAP